MSFTISLTGHGPKADTVQRVFEQAVRDLRADMGEHVDGWVEPNVTGSFSAGDVVGGSASGKAEDVE